LIPSRLAVLQTATLLTLVTCRNGDLVKLGPGDPGIIDELPAGLGSVSRGFKQTDKDLPLLVREPLPVGAGGKASPSRGSARQGWRCLIVR